MIDEVAPFVTRCDLPAHEEWINDAALSAIKLRDPKRDKLN